MDMSKLQELVMDREACRASVHGVAKSQTLLSHWTELNWLTKEMKTRELELVNKENHLKKQLGALDSCWVQKQLEARASEREYG